MYNLGSKILKMVSMALYEHFIVRYYKRYTTSVINNINLQLEI